MKADEVHRWLIQGTNLSCIYLVFDSGTLKQRFTQMYEIKCYIFPLHQSSKSTHSRSVFTMLQCFSDYEKNALSVICGLCDNSGVKFKHLILSVQLAPTADSKICDSISIHVK